MVREVPILYYILVKFALIHECSREALVEDGWFHSGDIGRVDEDGQWKVMGRSVDGPGVIMSFAILV